MTCFLSFTDSQIERNLAPGLILPRVSHILSLDNFDETFELIDLDKILDIELVL